jgi:hypothetical protein
MMIVEEESTILAVSHDMFIVFCRYFGFFFAKMNVIIPKQNGQMTSIAELDDGNHLLKIIEML